MNTDWLELWIDSLTPGEMAAIAVIGFCAVVCAALLFDRILERAATRKRAYRINIRAAKYVQGYNPERD